MNELKIAHRYAKAMFMHAIDNDNLDLIADDINKLNVTSNNIPELLLDLDKEDVPVPMRKQLANDICKSLSINDATSRLVELLVEKRRITLFPYIAIKFRTMVDEVKKNHRIKIIIANKNNKAEACKKAIDVLSKILGKKVYCECEIDKNIIGGAIIQIGDVVCDMSIAKKINDYEKKILWRLDGD